MNLTGKINIQRFEQGILTIFEDTVLTEKIITLFVNGDFFAEISCTGKDIKELAAGRLFFEGLINSIDEFHLVSIDEEQGNVYIELLPAKQDCCNDSLINKGPVNIDYAAVISALKKFQDMSPLFKETGGVHSAALLDREYGIRYFSEDMSRYNAVEKAVGKALIDGIALPGLMLVTSSRMPLELIRKAARAKFPAVFCISAPTLQSIRFARDNKIILAGMFRGSRINIYSHNQAGFE